jgi:hypothetical protein
MSSAAKPAPIAERTAAAEFKWEAASCDQTLCWQPWAFNRREAD